MPNAPLLACYALCSQGFHPHVPPYGFGDPTTYEVIASAVEHMNLTGAVRHGAECSNFYFPQEMDTEYLVVWEGLSPVRWKYVGPDELQSFLLERVSDGFAFPLNPKWVLCDAGWMRVFEALLQSAHASQPMEAWFPQASGLRERIFEIARQHPGGFVQLLDASGVRAPSLDPSLALGELERYETLKRAKRKLQALHNIGRASRAGRRLSMAGQARRQSIIKAANDRSDAEAVGEGASTVQTNAEVAAVPAPPSTRRSQVSWRYPLTRTASKGEDAEPVKPLRAPQLV
jgi:hypothetical protein